MGQDPNHQIHATDIHMKIRRSIDRADHGKGSDIHHQYPQQRSVPVDERRWCSEIGVPLGNQ